MHDTQNNRAAEASNEELLKWVEGEDVELAAQAVGEIGRRGLSGGLERIAGKAKSRDVAPSVRLAAIAVLGADPSSGQEKLLGQLLDDGDRNVAQSAALALGRVGTASAIPVLKAARARAKGASARRLEFAAQLVAYRLGLDDARWPVPRERLEPSRAARELPSLKASEVDVEGALEELQRVLPGVEFSAQVAAGFVCRGAAVYLLQSARVAKEGLAGLLRRPGIAGVVVKREGCPERWQVEEVVMAHAQGETLHVHGATLTGVRLHYGVGARKGQAFEIAMQALDLPRNRALEMRIRYDARARSFALEAVRLEQDRLEAQRRPRAPESVD